MNDSTRSTVRRWRSVANCSSLILSQIDLAEATGLPCDGPANHDMLTGEEIAAAWILDSELVTLSACETGLRRNVHHEGVIRFSHPYFWSAFVLIGDPR